ncbi:MAG: hypothetical protein UV73_C0006G0012 [Candidatus Gottesmanbacteria bacterium GW2011_GWA2_43_14]|uniref:Uncharacterized protein n=1 Tax=Candidatus Gottesmanbacteria bacterium GW2011_GWA2_43_14 TaxID=1618443 RepID=A0A0G1GFQ1_9BACT|nr:MAG: hypothetical protein UV73_C0006G0012 [Candidatus Gottesmanbacteria bacterium GW2011_GWA2_43_14]
MKFKFILSLFFLFLTLFSVVSIIDNSTYAVGYGCPAGWGCSGCSSGCTGEACTQANCCYANNPNNPDGTKKTPPPACLSYCQAECFGLWEDSCGPGKKITDEETFNCGACDNDVTCYKCGPDDEDEPGGPTSPPPPPPSNTPVPPPPTKTPTPASPTNTPTKTPTPTITPIPRPGLCESETIEKSTVFPGDGFILSSEAAEDVPQFYYAFYNLDNLYGPGNPKPFCVKNVGDNTTPSSNCPAGSSHLIYKDPDTSPRNVGAVTLFYEGVFVEDWANINKVPSKVSINAYFIDSEGRLSASDPDCVVTLNKGTGPPPPPGTPPYGTPPPGPGTPGYTPPPGPGTPPYGTPPPGGPACNQPCNPYQPFDCPEDCPSCPFVNPKCVPDKLPPGGPQCGEPCNPDKPNECPDDCPFCPDANPICVSDDDFPPSPTPGAPGCGEPCNPDEAFDCPDECPSCPTDNPICVPDKPPLGGPQCGEPCNPDQPSDCPDDCPFCPVTNPICVEDDDIAPTPTGAPSCGEPCSPETPYDCPEDCPSCPEVNPECVPAESPPGGPQCGEPCNPDQPNECPDECPFCPDANPQCDTEEEPRGPTPPAACDCDSVTYAGNFISGQTVTVTTFAVSLFPDTTEVRTMTYHVEKDGVEIGLSDPVPAEEISGSNGRYQTQWDFIVPEGEDAAGHYRIWVKIICGRITASVLGTETPQKTTFLDNLVNFLSNIFFLNKRNSLQPLAVATPTGIPDFGKSKPTVLAPTAKSLQLGTFHPVTNLKVGCKEISFDIL